MDGLIVTAKYLQAVKLRKIQIKILVVEWLINMVPCWLKLLANQNLDLKVFAN